MKIDFVLNRKNLSIEIEPAIQSNGATDAVKLFQGFAAQHDERVEQSIELGRAYRGTALLLGDLLKEDDEYTGPSHPGRRGALAARGRAARRE